MSEALLVLEDGTSFRGLSSGARGETFGELCFNTSMIGYPEVISDPSYAGQIVIMTYPQIGNYGIAREDLQRSTLALRGLIVRDMCYEPSHYRSEMSLPDLLVEQEIVAISGIDTRKLTRIVRNQGTMRAGISTVELNEERLLAKVQKTPGLKSQNLARTVSVQKVQRRVDSPELAELTEGSPPPRKHVVVYDCGVKRGILKSLMHSGCECTLVPWDTPASEVRRYKPDGVFFSNGPGDPEPVEATIQAAGELLEEVPLFGICLGHQILGKAIGAATEKLKFGHHGGNQPVMNLLTQKVEITAQNHGFGLCFDSIGALIPSLSGGENTHIHDLRTWSDKGIAPVVQSASHGRVQLTHVNLNDGTPEGIAFLDIPAFSVQYHPEASPGPADAQDLFAAFVRLMEGCKDYLAPQSPSDQKEGNR